METYAIKITQQASALDEEQLLFSKPLKSLEHLKKLEKRLITNDTTLARFANYFPKTKEALRVHNIFFKVFNTIIAFFSDLITYPSNYKERFKENIPVYKYLQSKGVSERVLNKNFTKKICFISRDDADRHDISLTKNIGTKDTTLSNYSNSTFFYRTVDPRYSRADENITSRFVL